jgi:large conductance mechanosensitive channel
MTEMPVHENAPKTEREKKVAAHARVKALRERSRKNFVAKQATGFMNFVREQGVVGLAVGLSIGTAATVLVKSIVDSMINPIIGAFLPGGASLSTKYACLTTQDSVCINKLAWGTVVSNLISFIAVAAMIYFVVKGLKLDKLDKKKDA